MTQSDLEFAAETLLSLLKNDREPFFDLSKEDLARVKNGLQESLVISKDLALFEGLAPEPGTGTFIDLLPDGKQRADGYRSFLANLSNLGMIGGLKNFLTFTKFRINADHIRTLVNDTLDSSGNKATYLLIHPGLKPDGKYTLVLAAGDRQAKTIKVGANPQVLDEINPCNPCDRLEQ
ncbi:hypothetical protein [Spirosoma validum]|uniref:Uncharacterized protein n=1 Tax=Spirosoma validum TaxID=2771355 RepID=A0A927B137_9BACT|nr:hypothetical protein [Spirosoma validum]MBD2753436.1 hypothetical protein [Spirosoma validum]